MRPIGIWANKKIAWNTKAKRMIKIGNPHTRLVRIRSSRVTAGLAELPSWAVERDITSRSQPYRRDPSSAMVSGLEIVLLPPDRLLG
jgi:hypothetical protein